MKKGFVYRKVTIVLLCMAMVFTSLAFTGCGSDNTSKTDDVTILYVNDSHTYINNVVKDKDGNETPGLSYASVAAMKKNLEKEGKNVILADCGDFIQGTSYGAIDKGKEMINILNATGIDVATIGNHEFDYGVDHLENIISRLNFPCISCNWFSAESNSQVLRGYKVIKAGSKKVAFVGITTPETMTTTDPTHLQDAEGNNLCDFLNSGNGEKFYAQVQKNIDEAKEEADYVIALGHLGVDKDVTPYRSTDVIANTTGLTAFIDGHSHTVVEGTPVKDKEGKDVWLTQAGSYLKAIGQMEISGNNVSTKLITDYKDIDETTAGYQDVLKKKVEDSFGEKIGKSDITFYNQKPNTTTRIVRNQETNLGDLTADAIYYMFNEGKNLNCDIAVNNGGNCREQVEPGEWTVKTCKDIEPFGNVMCLVQIKGQQLLDALEWSVKDVGDKNPDGSAVEFGGFFHVAGVKFDVDTSIPCTVGKSEDGTKWAGPPTGEYRVKNVMIFNKNKNAYEPLDLDRPYSIGGNNFTLRSGGDGYTMLRDNKVVSDFVDDDITFFKGYIKDFKQSLINSTNSPLQKYSNYGINYEDPYGSKRIVIK